ncbi:MAG: hypothetical protein JNK15_03615 [Planctomycetes bacterium]|nr:hypothetical protein [Planctomycetota bacterium]
MTRSSAFVVFSCLAAAACSSDTATFGPAQSFPKDQRPTVWDASTKDRLDLATMGPAQGSQDAGPKAWKGDTPTGWEELAAEPARFRNAQWKLTDAPGADCYLTVGVGGGVAGNLHRWYVQQFGKPSAPAPEALPPVEFAGRSGRLAELTGTLGGKAGQAALIAFYAEGDSVTSLKFTGPEAAVAGNKDKFLALAKSIRSAPAGKDPQAPPIDRNTPMPANHPPTGGATNQAAQPQPQAQPQPAAASPFAATVPADWTPKAGSQKPLHHTFAGDGEVYVSQLGGGLQQTLDIWRGEMGQKQPLTNDQFAALPKVAFLGEDAVLLDLTGDMVGMTKKLANARLLVAARADAGTITFCKLVAPAAGGEALLASFRQFCASVRRTQ